MNEQHDKLDKRNAERALMAEKGNGKVTMPKWLLILIITGVLLPWGEKAVGFFFDTKDATIAQVEASHNKDQEWNKLEFLRLEKDDKEWREKIDGRTLELLTLTTELKTEVKSLSREIDRLRDGR